MKKLLVIAALALSLGGCANFGVTFQADVAKVEQAWRVATQTTVTPQAALVIANSFNAASSAATAYLKYCKDHLSESICSADNRRTVIKAGRTGIALKKQVEGYVASKTAIPQAVYDTFKTVVNTLAASPAANFAGAK